MDGPLVILAFLALFDAGDRVEIATPGYPPYRHILTALDCVPVTIETAEATRGASPRHTSPGVDHLRASRAASGVSVARPSSVMAA